MGKTYHKAIGAPPFPVLSDADELVLEITPFDGDPLPGKCALSPEMVMLGCTTGHGAEALYELIEKDAKSR